MKNYLLLFCLFVVQLINAQSTVRGTLMDGNAEPISFANIVLYTSSDSTIAKVESSDVNGKFAFVGIPDGTYYVGASYIGYDDVFSDLITTSGIEIDLDPISMELASVELETAIVKAKRTLMEVKPDRTIFNVEGTINSAGGDALSLLRKAPGVLVDNNNSITVLSRSGVLIYVDGKRMPLTGDQLTAYLQNLPAEQIDRIDIITNPGAKYEAQGNAGIIDIRLKRNENDGFNGTIALTGSQGKFAKGNISTNGNYRKGGLNTFGTLGYNNGKNFNEMFFKNNQNGLLLDESNNWENANKGFNYRWGTDFYLGNNQTIGFLVGGQTLDGNNVSDNRVKISKLATVTMIDSVLIAANSSASDRGQSTYNLNYVFDNKKSSINFDLDYGRFVNDEAYEQPNRYYLADEVTFLSENLTEYDTPVSIDIYTAKVDYETNIIGGRLGLGTKFSKVSTDNTFLFYDITNGDRIQNNKRSNQFLYDENVYAGYTSYGKTLNRKWAMSAGLRVEVTDARGELKAFLPELQEDPVDLDYVNLFPSAGLTYNFKPNQSFALNYGRRINRPDYNVLNPFRLQLSEVSFSKGNERLRPEIVNNVELGYTLNYRYNFKLSYSLTTDQITRLIGPDDEDPRAGFISWDNLATQKTYGLNMSLPFGVTSWWNAFVNFSAGYLDNQADYGDGAIVDVQAFTYSVYQQHSFTLPGGFLGEVSGYYAGPGVWGGVFEYEPSWSLDLGIQKKFFNDNMNVRLAASDIFFQSGWSGVSSFNGLVGEGRGNWDSRRVSLSLSYNFGNSKVKSRKRSTGIEEEKKRVG